ncbi:ATP-binding protein [Pseudonocardia sp.]|uniref:ATP-binding protein n=1 Tax=Pseudonocardia sp. TaxID=60912 RepID=UPI003D0D0894
MPSPGNLPADASRIVGRAREVREVRALLGRARLVTLTGPGGIGKTRVALQVARDASRAFPGGAWFVELAALRDPALVEATVAAALGQEDGSTLRGGLADRIRSWDALLVLDNCEHLVQACAELVRDVLRGAPGVRVLATSREELGVTGEHVLPVAPLPVPSPATGEDPLPGLLACESAQLLLDRGRAIVPDFALTPDNAADVARLCRRLDGVPLAIELAGARLRTLSAGQIADRLDDPYRILTGGPRDAPARLSSAEDAVTWSYELCSPAEQALWARMSVFAGPVDADTVERVCATPGGPPDATADLLDGLVRKSVVVREPGGQPDAGDVPRFRMLDTIRHHGRLHLDDPHAGAAELARRHADHHEALVRRAEAEWFSDRQVIHAHRLRRALPDLRVAVDHRLRGDDPDRALRMASDLRAVWLCLGNLREGDLWLRRALDVAPPRTPAGPRASWLHGWIQLLLGAEDAARASLARAHDAAQELGQPAAGDHATALLAAADAFAGDLDRAVDGCRAALAGRRADGDVPGVAFVLMLLGEMHWARGELDDALACATESEALCGATGEVWCRSYAVWVQALALSGRGEAAEAARAAQAALEMKRRLGDTVGMLLVAEVLSWTLGAEGRWADAGLLHAALRPRWDGTCSALMGFGELIAQRNRWDERIGSHLGTSRLRRVQDAGAALSVDEAVRVALDGGARAPVPGRTRRDRPAARDPLTPRETEVAALLADGLSNRDIAARLVISPRTAEVHVERVLVKLGFTRRAQVAGWWHGAPAGPDAGYVART